MEWISVAICSVYVVGVLQGVCLGIPLGVFASAKIAEKVKSIFAKQPLPPDPMEGV